MNHSLNTTIVTLSNAVTLHISIIVLAGPNEPSLRLDHIGHHIVDEPMLIPYFLCLELFFIFFIVYPFEDILEPTIVLLQNRVLGCEVKWIVPLKCKLEATLCKFFDAFIGVIHRESNSSLSFKIIHLHPLLLSTFALEDHLEGSRLVYREIGGLVLITKCMPSDDNRHFPAWNEPRDVFYEYGLSKDSAIEDIPDGSVRTLPHLFQIKLLYSSLIRGNGGALDAYFVFLDCLSCINGNLVICGITMLNAQIEVFDFKVEKGENQLLLDGLPNDPGHLVAVHLYHGIDYLYFLRVHGLLYKWYDEDMRVIWLLKVYVDQDFICQWACFSISWRMDWLLWCFRAGQFRSTQSAMFLAICSSTLAFDFLSVAVSLSHSTSFFFRQSYSTRSAALWLATD